MICYNHIYNLTLEVLNNMNKMILKTERTEKKFPLPFITPKMIVNATANNDTIEFLDAVPTMEYTDEDAIIFLKCREGQMNN